MLAASCPTARLEAYWGQLRDVVDRSEGGGLVLEDLDARIHASSAVTDMEPATRGLIAEVAECFP